MPKITITKADHLPFMGVLADNKPRPSICKAYNEWIGPAFTHDSLPAQVNNSKVPMTTCVPKKVSPKSQVPSIWRLLYDFCRQVCIHSVRSGLGSRLQIWFTSCRRCIASSYSGRCLGGTPWWRHWCICKPLKPFDFRPSVTNQWMLHLKKVTKKPQKQDCQASGMRLISCGCIFCSHLWLHTKVNQQVHGITTVLVALVLTSLGLQNA